MPKYAVPDGMARTEVVIDAGVLAAARADVGRAGLSALVERLLADRYGVEPSAERQPVGYPAGRPRKPAAVESGPPA